MNLVFGVALICMTLATEDRCQLFYYKAYATEQECKVNLPNDVKHMEELSAPAKVEDSVCLQMNRKSNI